ncbi:hypothetical protein SPHV1_2270006 [Novosphingobium sp. KN65.2]|nr:hypothetical protein SPHV1_2270006 [Novosphingobium sp. KN65.2]
MAEFHWLAPPPEGSSAPAPTPRHRI